MVIYPYKAGSKSAKALAEALGIKRAKREGDVLRTYCLINWGCSVINRDIQLFGGMHYLNHPEVVKKASNKLSTFKTLGKGVSTPQWTESRVEAQGWLAEGVTVVARQKLTGHSGEGIVIVSPGEELVEAPLYTAYINKAQEYRLHVFQDEVFFVQRKARNKAIPDDQVNWKIRNHGNGFIFAHKDVDVPHEAKTSAITAVAMLGLDFGAVDVILGKNGEWYILEINTACGLEGTTLEKYCEQFRKFI